MKHFTARPTTTAPTHRTGSSGLLVASKWSVGRLAACVAVALIGCAGASDAEIGVQTAPPSADSTTIPPRAPSTSTPTPTSTSTSSGDPQAATDDAYRQFSACMRENGYPDFEDFTSDVFAGVTSQEEGAKIFNEEMLRRGVDLADPATGPAMEACQHYLDEAAALAPEVPGADEQAQQELILAFAECMRSQGVEDWPDPDFAANPPTGYSLEEIQSFDYQDPAIRAAGQYCDPNGEVLALFGR